MPGKRGSRGGRRQGQPGKTYQNRTDLNQAPRAVPGQTYGQAGAQLAAQRVVPLPAGGGGVADAPAAPPPPPLDAPTQRPAEPLTTGIPSGPGAGPEAILRGPQPIGAPDPIDEVRAMYAAYPTDDMRRLLAFLTDEM